MLEPLPKADASRPPIVVLTMGEPAGIGGEIAMAAWLRRAEHPARFALIDDPGRLSRLARQLNWRVPVHTINDPSDCALIWPRALPVLPIKLAAPVIAGEPTPANSIMVIEAIERAVKFVQTGRADAVVTNPIHKHVLADAGFVYPGHTEFLAALSGARLPIMMLACSELRVVPVTVHCSLSEAIRRLSVDMIVAAARITAQGLERYFDIQNPRLMLAGLNPHAGEGGLFGREEFEIISPAVEILREQGFNALGPASPDTLFHAQARRQYDAVLCMYHDQALIPVKTIDFAGGVNITLGLPFLRTSPDHGTAFDIAGTGTADPSSLIAALGMAMTGGRHAAAYRLSGA